MKSMTPAKTLLKTQLPPQLRRRIDRHFLACSATFGAGVAMAASGHFEAKGDILYSGTVNAVVPFNNFAGLYFDLDTLTMTTANVGGVSDVNLFDTFGSLGSSYYYHSVSFFGPNNAANASLSADGLNINRLAAGAVVGSSGAFDRQNDFAFRVYYGSSVVAEDGNWFAGGTGFIGFRFVNASNQTNYGWMRLTFNPAAYGSGQASLTVVDYAYDNMGQSIMTGQTTIPEPSSTALAFLAGGAAGLYAWRRQRRENSSAQRA